MSEEWINDSDMRRLTPDSTEWPSALNDLGARMPGELWVSGPSLELSGAVAVTGSRACSGYGSLAAAQLGMDLACSGRTVVSGVSLGIESAVSRGVMAERGGRLVVVLACGIDLSYPARSEALLAEARRSHTVVSPFPLGTSPCRLGFEFRGSVLAALGAGLVVVEAETGSGSLAMAREAHELGRVVMAVPGPVTSNLSRGTNSLIRHGAGLVEGCAQVLERLEASETARG